MKNTVAKLFHHEDSFEEEVDGYKALFDTTNIDPKHEYTIPMKASCEMTVADYPLSEIAKCNNIELDIPPKQNKLWQIVYDDGGDDLNQIVRSGSSSFEEIFLGMRGIFKNLYRIRDAGMVHQDIKPANVLYNPATKKCYLIDFGLLCEIDNIYRKRDQQHIVRAKYDFFPTEYGVFSWLSRENNLHNIQIEIDHKTDPPSILANNAARNYIMSAITNREQFSNRVLQTRLKEIHDSSPKQFAIYERTIYNRAEWYTDLANFTEKIKSQQDWYKYLAGFTGKIDTYMLGITLTEVLVNSDVRPSNQRFLEKVLKLLRDMTRVDPEERLDPSKLWGRYQEAEALLAKRSRGSILSRVTNAIRGNPQSKLVTKSKSV